MVDFRRSGTDRVNVFEVDDSYVFKHYFEGEEVFARLKKYYNHQQYRFEVPKDEYDPLESYLANRRYDLVVVDDVADYVVVVRKYTQHPENIFKASVVQRSVGEYNCFLLTDSDAVEQAVRENAMPLAETGLDNPF